MISHNGALIWKSSNPVKFHGCLRYAKTFMHGQEVYVAKHTWGNVEALRRCGMRAPSPPMEEWQYTGRFPPMIHQRTGTEFCVRHPRLFNLSDMGTGKTATSLWACEYLFQRNIIRRVLIVCPLSVMGVWNDELFNIAPHRVATVLFGSRQKRLDLLAQGTQFCIINHDGLATISSELANAGFDLIIADEASVYRNTKTERFKIFKRFTEKIYRLWLLTGTPAPTAPSDVFGLIKLVEGKEFNMSFGGFKELTMRKVSQFVWVPRNEANEIIYKLMKPAIRFRKEDCLDLPPLTYVNRACLLSAEQQKAFESMRKTMVMSRDGDSNITAANAAVMLQKLMQICCGVVKDNDAEAHSIDCSPRLSLLQEIIEEAGNKAIIFAPFKGVMENINKFLGELKISCEVVNGDTSSGRREEIFSSFQRGSLEVLLAHPRTAAHGLTLTASSTIIWFGPIFSAELYSQGNARIHRAGQKKNCTVVHMGGHALEWKLYEALSNKLKLQDRILELYDEYFG